MRKSIIYLFGFGWLFLAPQCVFSQKSKEDVLQLKSKLDLNLCDSTQFSIYSELIAYYNSTDIDSLLEYANRAVYKVEKDPKKDFDIQLSSTIGGFYRGRSWAYYKKGQYLNAITDLENAKKYYEKPYDRKNMGRLYIMFGNIYYRQKIYDIAEQNYTKSLQLLGIYQNDMVLSNLYLNYGGFLVNRKRYEEAWDMFNEALNIYQHNNYVGSWGLLYNNMGVCAGYLGDTEREMELFHKAIAEYEKHNNKINIVNGHYNLGVTYQKSNKYDLSIRHLNISINKANETGIIKNLADAHEVVSEAYFEKSKLAMDLQIKDSLFSNAIQALKKSKWIKDSLFNAQNNLEINELLTKYENERKEKEIQKLNFQSELNLLEFRQQEIELQTKIFISEAERERILKNHMLKQIALEKLEKENHIAQLELKVRSAHLIEQEALTQIQNSEIELLHQTNRLKDMQQARNKNLSSILWVSLSVLLLITLLILLLYFEKQKAHRNMLKHNLEIEKQQKEIELQNVRLENINKFKDIFISNMSHEIRTPLNTIIGFSNLLAKADLNDNQKHQIESIEFASENLLALVNDILDFSKLESGNIQFEFNEFDLVENLEKLISMFQYQADEKNLLLSLNIDNQVPKFVKTDKYRLNQIIINLIGNAIKFTAHGFVKMKVEVQSVTDGVHNILFTVSDSGSGIEYDHLDRIFESYTQLNNYNYMNHNGTGLGLAICKKLVELFGGKISATSEIGKGSSFTFNIPLEASEILVSQTPQYQISTPIAHKKILIVEDNTLNQTVIKTLLKSINENLSLNIVGNGQLALDILESETFDLIFMDMKMPVMDGLTATSLIRQNNIPTPIIALTANATKEEKQKCLEVGMNDFMVKPIDPSLLREKIDFWLSIS